jgi:hypothetical protein
MRTHSQVIAVALELTQFTRVCRQATPECFARNGVDGACSDGAARAGGRVKEGRKPLLERCAA